MVHRSAEMDDDVQKNLILSAIADLPERKSSRASLRKTSVVGDYNEVVVDPFPALPIKIRLPSLRGTSSEHSTQSTTDILKQCREEERLKPWGKLEVLPDTDATAALAQLALNDSGGTKEPDNARKKFPPSKRRLKRSASLEGSLECLNKEHKVIMPKLRFISQTNCHTNDMDIVDLVHVKEDFKIASEALERRTVFLFGDKESGKDEADVAKEIRYALFEPLNWIYDGCLTDEEFEEKWATILEAHNRFQRVRLPKKPVSPTSPQPHRTEATSTSCGRRHSFDKSIGFAKRTINRTAHYFLQKLRDTVSKRLLADHFSLLIARRSGIEEVLDALHKAVSGASY
ncbi:unnamed protein product [Nippostrongylus brasiliensis]|uniref:SH2 domain-containing protein n=1 Tax=Nippostrongylus brasiliensis TaxID=27835 RepID=A0A0N4YAV8_NIPBR|nr:unnamed protein product [Nippostrongylus brasiliensis]